jgi:hypothetical protein
MPNAILRPTFRIPHLYIAFVLALAAIPLLTRVSGAQGQPESMRPIRSTPKDLRLKTRPVIPDDILVGRKGHAKGIKTLGAGAGGATIVAVGAGGEPSIAIDPANTDHIVITSFFSFNGDAPLYYSIDGGATWNQYFSVPDFPNVGGIPNDQAVDYGRAGILYGAFLTFNTQIATGGTPDPTSLLAWKWPLDGAGNCAFADFNGTPFASDQPWFLVNRDPVLAGQDNLYTGYDDFATLLERVSVAPVPVPGILPAPFVRDNVVGPFGGPVNPGFRLGNDRASGKMYGIWQFCTGQNPMVVSPGV